MCGIAGIVSFKKHGLPVAEQLKKMTDTLKHRGPDDEGFAFFTQEGMVTAGGADTPAAVYDFDTPYRPSCDVNTIKGPCRLALGHRRLSIIDLSPTGHQPMSYDQGRLWIAFNGEIYNYQELRDELAAVGADFSTQTDTEVILAAYAQWGKDCLQRFNGMWAFVIYDSSKNILFGARDRFGVKPMYYFQDSERFAFASEHKALLQLDGIEKTINPAAAFEYLVLGKTESTEHSMFMNIFELMPAHHFTLHLDSGKMLKEKYYSLEYTQTWEEFRPEVFSRHVEKIRELLFNAVKLRLRSDVPVGSCLSGGVDSSTLVCITDRLLNSEHNGRSEEQQVFTASFKDNRVDESAWAEKIVAVSRVAWHQVYPDARGLLRELEDLAYVQDVPMLGTNTYSHYCVMKKVQEQGIKVTLDGQGADELFSGYAPHFVSFFYEALKNNSWLEVRNGLSNPHPSFSDSRLLLTFPTKSILAKVFFPYFKNSGFRKAKKEFSYINKKFWNEHKEQLGVLKGNFNTSLNAMLHQQLTGPDLKVMLKASDRNAMRFSIESRVPFSDDMPLIEYLFKIPAVYKIRNAQSKSLLRAAIKGIVPEEVRLRKDKKGFASPEYNWLHEIKDELRQYITPDLNPYINTEALLKDWDQLFMSAPPHATHRLFRIINFAVWKKVFKL